LAEGKPLTVRMARHGEPITYRLESASVYATGLWERMDQNPLPDSYFCLPDQPEFATIGRDHQAPSLNLALRLPTLPQDANVRWTCHGIGPS
jgi:hypothetical protein